MHFVMLASSFAMEPVSTDPTPAIKAAVCFAVAAVVGWPFSILLAVPFVVEQLFFNGQQSTRSLPDRVFRLSSALLASLSILVSPRSNRLADNGT